MKQFDIAPFSLPDCAAGEVRFEEPRDIARVVVNFRGVLPSRIGLSYMRKNWPQCRVEQYNDLENPFPFGWIHVDDWFNCEWQQAAVSVRRETESRAALSFRSLAAEFAEMSDYDVPFRRSLGIRLDVDDPRTIRKVAVFTMSTPAKTRLRVELDAGRRTLGETLCVEGYNARIGKVMPGAGTTVEGKVVRLDKGRARRNFKLDVACMRPAHRYCGDDAHVRFVLKDDAFTISLPSLESIGPVWFADKGVFITVADDTTPFSRYHADCRARKTVAAKVLARPEQTYAGAYLGQPRPHAVAYSLGCKQARQRFWLDPNGDVVLTKKNVDWIPGVDTLRYANPGDGRFCFGLETWSVLGRYPDPAPAPVYNIHFRQDGLELDQKSLAVPLDRAVLEGEPRGDESIICLQRFRFRNVGNAPVTAELSIRYAPDSRRMPGLYGEAPATGNAWFVPVAKLEKLRLKDDCIYGTWQGKPALRCVVASSMTATSRKQGIVFSRRLRPGESCEAVLKVPFVNLDTEPELEALRRLDFFECHRDVVRFWRQENEKGARVRTPVPQLNDLHMAHLTHVQVTDPAMPAEPPLINTSVGSSTYGNFCNESCMINQELDQRGLSRDARRRLDTWVRYQGTVPQAGNFTDFDGMYFGAGGFEHGQYNQHHGWVLWRVAEHFLYTLDRDWFSGVVDSLIAASDWVFRQRRNTMTALPHSRGWEYGFLPAGSLEDVTDFFYWLSTNTLTWRGVDTAARALEQYGHPAAQRLRKEADAYACDLRNGFEKMRQHTPLVPLRDGRWVPHCPSRLYCRGRDVGWIREVLEGSIYLLISGLYEPDGKEAGWILDDYQDNRYMNPPFGYAMTNPEQEWHSRGGFSCQPNLLAGLMPYLDRDEPEIYIWMFFNAWCACFREEIGAMVEHPQPVLGYSNCAHFKTSDQANAVMWLRYMFVYTLGETLHFGRAVPRAWFAAQTPIGAEKIATVFGTVGITYEPDPDGKRLAARVSLELRRQPRRILVRFRHPEKKPIRAVSVDGRDYDAFNPRSGDVDLTGCRGLSKVEAWYA